MPRHPPSKKSAQQFPWRWDPGVYYTRHSNGLTEDVGDWQQFKPWADREGISVGEWLKKNGYKRHRGSFKRVVPRDGHANVTERATPEQLGVQAPSK